MIGINGIEKKYISVKIEVGVCGAVREDGKYTIFVEDRGVFGASEKIYRA